MRKYSGISRHALTQLYNFYVDHYIESIGYSETERTAMNHYRVVIDELFPLIIDCQQS